MFRRVDLPAGVPGKLLLHSMPGRYVRIGGRSGVRSGVSALLYSLLALIVANGTTSSLGIYWRLVSCGVARRSSERIYLEDGDRYHLQQVASARCLISTSFEC
jgi:hypothetical protein